MSKSGPEFEIIALPPEQWPAYKALRLEALQSDPQAFGASHAAAVEKPDAFWHDGLVRAAQSDGQWILFARTQNRFVGMIGAFVGDSPVVASVVMVYVTQSERGQGIARQLMNALITEVRYSGVGRLRLTVNSTQHAAVALYKSSGFAVIGTENARLGDGNFHDEFLMERLLF